VEVFFFLGIVGKKNMNIIIKNAAKRKDTTIILNKIYEPDVLQK
jgi:hypothetical protein